MFKKLLLNTIRFYQKNLSPKKGIFKTLFLVDSACRFKPTCSEYTYQAINHYGIICGVYLSIKRIIRCHPFSKGGYDPVPQKLK